MAVVELPIFCKFKIISFGLGGNFYATKSRPISDVLIVGEGAPAISFLAVWCLGNLGFETVHLEPWWRKLHGSCQRLPRPSPSNRLLPSLLSYILYHPLLPLNESSRSPPLALGRAPIPFPRDPRPPSSVRRTDRPTRWEERLRRQWRSIFYRFDGALAAARSLVVPVRIFPQQTQLPLPSCAQKIPSVAFHMSVGPISKGALLVPLTR